MRIPGSPEWQAHVASMLAEEASQPEQWWYLSFGETEERGGFLGACVVRGRGPATSLSESHRLGINPGGQVMHLSVGDDPGPIPTNRLLSKAELEFYDDLAGVVITEEKPMPDDDKKLPTGRTPETPPINGSMVERVAARIKEIIDAEPSRPISIWMGQLLALYTFMLTAPESGRPEEFDTVQRVIHYALMTLGDGQVNLPKEPKKPAEPADRPEAISRIIDRLSALIELELSTTTIAAEGRDIENIWYALMIVLASFMESAPQQDKAPAHFKALLFVLNEAIRGETGPATGSKPS